MTDKEYTEEQAMFDLVRVYGYAKSGKPLVSNQGQALDGYSELAEYRAIIEEYIENHNQ
jgi:hypothetical protein